MIDSAEQDEHGLLIKGVFHSTDEAQRARTVVKERMSRGKSVSASIGYNVLDDALETRDGKSVRVLKAVELYEFSFVNVPCNPMAMVTEVKSAPLMSEIKAEVANLRREVKEGRALSTANRSRLKAIHDSLHPACKDLQALLEETDPDDTGVAGDEPVGTSVLTNPGDVDNEKAARLAALAKARASLQLLSVDPSFYQR
jgi:hypothetical protein